jgi:hypothetical protein
MSKEKKMRLRSFSLVVLVILAVGMLGAMLAPLASADTLKSADAFAVLAGSTVTSSNFTHINGDLGVSPGMAVSGFPPGDVTGGTIHAGDAVAAQAQVDLGHAFTTEALIGAAGTLVTGGVLNNFNGGCGTGCYKPGAYLAPATSLTGTIFLKDGGVPNSVFVFYTGAGAALTTATNSVVNVSGLSPTDSVFWVVGSSATLGVSSVFYGDILALTSITFDVGAQDLCGRALAQHGGVTFSGEVGPVQNQVAIGCVGNLMGSNGLGGGLLGNGGGTSVPEPGTLLLLGSGFAGLGMVGMRRERARRA